jgi:photosystem II stability/assembly factor-like uncharacterized protein
MSSTTDGGSTFTTFRLPTQRNFSLTWGIASLDSDGTLVMQADDALYGSENDGCRWTKIGSEAVGIYRVAAGPQGHAYAWQDNGGAIYQVTHGDTPNNRWSSSYRKSPINGMKGFAVDPNDPLHVRTASDPGQIYDSVDGGLTWRAIGVPAMPGGVLGYVTSFDPNDLDHVVYGRVTDGGYVTFDGGQTWTKAKGLAAIVGSPVNFFNAVISPADGNTVFAVVLDRSNGTERRVYSSIDGGLTYTPRLNDGVNGVYLTNSTVMKADHDDPNLLRFVFSSSPVFGGTFFYEYDLGSDTVTTTPNASLPRVREIEPSRASPGKLHVGFDFN